MEGPVNHTARRTPPERHVLPGTARRARATRRAAALLAGVLLTSACGGTPTSAPAEPGRSPAEPGRAPAALPAGPAAGQHVHGLARNPGDGKVYLATHAGLFRYDPDGPRRVGPVLDLMGFTVAGPDRFLASGHPGTEATQLPQPLGLVESTDGGQSWSVLSRGGESDFHALTASSAAVVGFDGAVRSSPTGRSWRVGRIPATPHSLAASPDGSTVLATTEAGLLASRDQGLTWQAAGTADGPPLALLAWADETTVVGLGVTGSVAVSDDGGTGWRAAASTPAQPQALAAGRRPDGTLEILLATSEGIVQSLDGGASFRPLEVG